MTSEMMPLLLALSTITISLTIFYFTRWKKWNSRDDKTSDKKEEDTSKEGKPPNSQNSKGKSQNNSKQTKKQKASPKVVKSKENTDRRTVLPVKKIEAKQEDKPPRKSTAVKKSKHPETEPVTVEDDVGFSFFKSRRETNLKRRKAKLEENKTNLNISELKAANVDNLGFSFVPHKDRRNLKEVIETPKKSTLIDLYRPNQRTVQQNSDVIQHREVRVESRVKFFEQKTAEPLKSTVTNIINTKDTSKCKYSEILVRGTTLADFVKFHDNYWIDHQNVDLAKEDVEERPVETPFYTENLDSQFVNDCEDFKSEDSFKLTNFSTSIRPTVFSEEIQSKNSIEEEFLINDTRTLETHPQVSGNERNLVNTENQAEKVAATFSSAEEHIQNIKSGSKVANLTTSSGSAIGLAVEPTELLSSENAHEIKEVRNENCFEEPAVISTNGFHSQNTSADDSLIDSAIQNCDEPLLLNEENQAWNSIKEQVFINNIINESEVLVENPHSVSAIIQNVDLEHLKVLSRETLDIEEVDINNCLEEQAVHGTSDQEVYSSIDNSLDNSAVALNTDADSSKFLGNEEIDQVNEIKPHTVEQAVSNINQLEVNSQVDGTFAISAVEVEPSKELNEKVEQIKEIKSINAAEKHNLEDFTKNKTESDVESLISEKSPVISLEENIFKMEQVRVLVLNDKEHNDSTLYRIKKNWILQFRLGPSLLGRKVTLYCNYPRPNEEFSRNTYHVLKWHQDSGCSHSDDTALLTEIKAGFAGSFHYYFIYDESDDNKKHQGSGFFLVDPVLKFGKNEELPLDCIQCQTVMAKHLGTFDTWESKLRVGKEAGYNMIHFTPIQMLGSSNSGYSLSGQLQLNPAFDRANGKKTSFGDVEQLMKKMRSEWKVTSICDIVLNHTANESEWLLEHPEATYNCSNCTHLRPAYLLDAILHQFSVDVSKGLYEDKGIPVEVNNEDHLQAIRYHLHQKLAEINISELYICDVNKYVNEFLDLTRNKVPPTAPSDGNEELTLVQDPAYRRLSSTIDIQLALKLFNVYRSDCFDEESRIKRCNEDFKNTLNELNNNIVRQISDHMNAAVENCVANIRYFRVDPNGPKIKEISVDNPLVPRYFTDYGTPTTLAEHQKIMYDKEKSKFLMAHNGWVMNADPLQNFASPGSNIYIRRELIAWGDSVKLRYGDKPEDCPFLWNHMRSYVEQIATIFDGVRLDNCHSTPIPVAEYLLDCARKVRPDLYVVAELFTNSDMTDNIFVNRLGITSLIREALSAWNSHEQGRLVYRYGGVPVGSFYQPNVRPLVPSIAHAMFLDLTHDNPSPVEKRSVYDLLPSTALVNMACCASGSSRGYDELVPHHIHVVEETRQYTEWSDKPKDDVKFVTKDSGIILAKKALNDLHYLLGSEGFDQVYVDQMDPDVVAVTRHCPKTHQSYILVAFTAFQPTINNYQRSIRPLRVEGLVDEIVIEASLVDRDPNSKSEHAKDSEWINGLKGYKVNLRQHISLQESEVFHQVDSGTRNVTQLNFKNFKHGSIVVVKVSLPSDMLDAIKNVQKVMGQFSAKKDSELAKVIGALTLPDLNRALYRCGQEERDEGNNFDTYNIPNFGSLVYAGLQGFMSVLSNIRPNNDLGHPLCDNLRNGDWMIDYVWKRLKLDNGTEALGQWFEENSKSLKAIPRYLIPCYFDAIITGMYVLLIEQSYSLMSRFVKDGSTFVKGLSMGSLQFAAYIKSADLPQLSPKLKPPCPPQRKDVSGKSVQACVTLSAGLPHFSTGYMRNWGRDTFIALRGLFILTGRYEDARYHILGYAACLRHGLIPNLLDGGRNSRFNCRDAVWWWLYCIKCYVEDAPNGVAILSDMVSRIFPTDDSPAQSAGAVDQPLCDVMQEALNVHFQGLSFRERNAGRQIDEHMVDNGFNNQIGVHPETGFVFGGNGDNCGTWMDKMGSSDKAGNRGKPATPRDGSAVELIGLSKAAISWLHALNQKGQYPYDGVERTSTSGSITKWTFKSWADRIQQNFEKYFWMNTSPSSDDTKLINKRGIYKDCHGASQPWTDYQLRCNFPIAMVAAPELFDAHHAWTALQNVEKYLLGPLGMKTLDPEDWAYNGDYDNSNDSDNPSVSHGFNYHQGPEWVWPVGFFLRAKIHFASANNSLQKTLADTKRIMSRHFVELQTSPWRGLPELTNKNGAYCSDSSRTQAWSMSCILEVLHDLRKIELKQPIVN